MNLNFIGKIYIVHHSASNIPVVYFRSEFLKELRVTTGHYVWLVMEAMVPGQIATLQNRPHEYHPHLYQNRPNLS
jgi:hypothetical protein